MAINLAVEKFASREVYENRKFQFFANRNEVKSGLMKLHPLQA